jgi:heat shock protein HslJ
MLIPGFVSVVLLVFAFPAAQATPTVPGPGIPPDVWQLVALTGTDGVPIAIDDPTRYTVQFLLEGRLTAKLDCNQGSAGFTASDGVLEVSVMAATLALCEPGSHGDAFGRILQYATSYDIDADGFLWLRGDEGVLQLRPAFSAMP